MVSIHLILGYFQKSARIKFMINSHLLMIIELPSINSYPPELVFELGRRFRAYIDALIVYPFLCLRQQVFVSY